MEDRRKYIRIVLNILIPLLGIYVVFFWGPRLLVFFMPFVIGWILALIANPLVRFLEKRASIVRKHSSVALIFLVVGGLIALIYLAAARLILEIRGFVETLPQLFASIRGDLEQAVENLTRLIAFLPDDIENTLLEIGQNLGDYVTSLFQTAAAPTVEMVGHVAMGIPNVLVYTVVTILSAYFFIVEQDSLRQQFKRLAPQPVLLYCGYVKRDIKRLIGGYFLAQFRIMFVVAFILLAGFVILGVPYGFLLAILIAMLDFLPIFGTGTVLIPWAVFRLFTGNYAYAVGLILIYVTTQVVRQIIQPKIVGDSMGLPPLTTLFLLYLGFKVRGIAGMIMAVPIGLIVINFYKYGAFDSLIENVKLLIKEIHEMRRGE